MKGVKKFFIIFLFAFTGFNSNAQQAADSSAQQVKKTKMLHHYIGLQANQLFKQFLNLDATNTVVSNPYLFTYSVYYSKLHLGIQGGFGYDYKRTKDNLSPSDLQTTVNNIFYRYGIVRNYALGKKWEATTGLNYVGNSKLNRTLAVSVVHSNVTITDSTSTISTTVSKRKGGELQLSLGLHISEHVMLFTEASFHYYVDRDKSNVLISESITNSALPENDTFILTTSNSDTREAVFDIRLPLALFLTIKF
ncbi:MAG TPA: hypothetical protein VJY62_21045 [Bacteroidia bacterium]|nr:hypothetical protein [Bacteroidia bacterium]